MALHVVATVRTEALPREKKQSTRLVAARVQRVRKGSRMHITSSSTYQEKILSWRPAWATDSRRRRIQTKLSLRRAIVA